MQPTSRTARLALYVASACFTAGCMPNDYNSLRLRVEQLENERSRTINQLEIERTKTNAEKEKLLQEISDLKAKIPKEDFQYTLLKKEYTPGTLIETKRVNTMTRMPEKERVNPKYILYFKGIHTGKDYPPIEVSEAVYNSVSMARTYGREDIANYKR